MLLVALLEPDIALAIPVDQRAGCLAPAYEERVPAKMRNDPPHNPGVTLDIKIVR